MSNENWTQLLKRIEAIETEVRQIKHAIKQEIQTELHANHVVTQKELKEKVEINVQVQEREPEKSSKNWEVELGQKWLPRVFLFVLMIGFIWGFAAAVEEGWITEPVRIIIGFAVAFLLYVTGEKQIKANRRNLGIVLLAGAIILLMLTTFAMNALYGYIGFWSTFILHVAWIGLGLFFSYKHRSEVLGILVSIGGYLVPFLIEGAQNQNALLFYGYEGLLYGGFLLYAIKNSYKILHYVSFILLHIVTLVYSFISSDDYIHYAIFLFWVQHFILTYAFLVHASFKKSHLYATLLTSFFLNYMWTTENLEHSATKWTLLLVSIVYILASVLTWKEKNEKRAFSITLATIALGLFALYHFDEVYTPIIYVIQGMAAIYFAKTIQDKIQWSLGSFLLTIGAIITLESDLTKWFSIESLSYALCLGAFIYLFKTRKDEFFTFIPNYKRTITVILSGFVLIYTTQLTELMFVNASSVTTAIAVSVSWLLYSIAFIMIGKRKNHSSFNIFGIIMLFIVLLKVIFVDLSFSSITIKAVLFVSLGLVGLMISRVFYQNDKTKK